MKVWTAKEVEYLQQLDMEPLSLNKIVESESGDEDAELGDFIADTAPGPEELAMLSVMSDDLMKIMDKLTPREMLVIQMRFGFFDGVPKTLEEIGGTFSVTRERIRQVEARALRKLRKYAVKLK